MDELEELKKRKEKLELERDIASLELKTRKERLEFERDIDRLEHAQWHWVWIAPLCLVGAVLIAISPNKGFEAAVVGMAFALPTMLKVFLKP